MECIFLNSEDTTLFVRDDMESGHWVQEQMNLTADFPFVSVKRIEIGQRIAFRDPATDIIQVFEIINVENHEPEHYQQITAEHICIAELSDEHIEKTEFTDKTAAEALEIVLAGTLWSVGHYSEYDTQNADITRGCVWDAINTIQQNWNVYITPRIVISSDGAITGRYLDIEAAQGTWRGLRLSVRKNLLDPSVTYNESEIYTALYGYGGSVEVAQSSGDDKTEELTFKNEVWEATAEHPAKPANQTYLEWPEKTALYGRNGRPRFGYYQNGSIKDASVLLEKTWESLQLACKPKISISGTCVDLHRLGYTNKPLRLHDTAIIEIEETGEQFFKQIVCCDIDLIDPTGSRVQIGDYIPNIIYINRDTNKKAGGGGGGRGPKSMTNLEDDDAKTFTEFIRTQQMIGMVVGTIDGENYIRGGEITLAINEDGGTTATIKADCIDIDGLVLALSTEDLSANNFTVGDTITLIGQDGAIECNTIDAAEFQGGKLTLLEDGTIGGTLGVTGNASFYADIAANGNASFGGTLSVTGAAGVGSLSVNGYAYSYKTKTVVTDVGVTLPSVTRSNAHYFLYSNSSSDTTPVGATSGRVITGFTDGSVSPTTSTIYYLGRDS